MLTASQWMILIGVIVIVAIAAAVLFDLRLARRRHAVLRRRFGPEYDREVERQHSVPRAERELIARAERVRDQRVHPLPEPERARFSERWDDVQARFVDDPEAAVQTADELIKGVMLAQGYDVTSFDQRVADLSVDHAGVVQHYRAAHALADANREGRADTEELRQAMVHYRALFADLLQQPVYEGRLSQPRMPPRGERLPR